MKKTGFAMCLSLALMTGCMTPLTGIQKCALLGEVYTGSSYGHRTEIGSVGPQIYSYGVQTINPNCRMPQTAAERTKIDEVRPAAEALKTKNQKILWAWYGATFGALIIATAAVYLTTPKPAR